MADLFSFLTHYLNGIEIEFELHAQDDAITG